jgi:predicted ATPase
LNYSVCFSANADYFLGIRNFAEPAVRFYNKLYIAPFTPEEITDYVRVVFGLQHAIAQELASWLFQKTLGHPFFLPFISRQLLTSVQPFVLSSAARQWPEILHQLEKEKFSCDLGQASDKEIELLKSIAQSAETEVIAAHLVKRSYYMYLQRLTEKGLLVRTGRGKYKLYHPLFKLFLQALQR